MPACLDSATPEAIDRAADRLHAGGLVAFPTETVYGLGADGLNPQAVQKIFAAKGRPADHPLILHVAARARAKTLAAEWPTEADRLAQAFWPGPLTLILKRAAHVPDAVTGGQDTVGVRMPAHPVAIALLSAFERIGSGVVAAPSANRFGGVSPTRASDVAQSLGDRLDDADIILDGGDCAVGVESTIVDLSGEQPRILRPGGVSRTEIECVLDAPLATGPSVRDATVPRVSGSLESHYAPSANTLLVNRSEFLSAVARCREAGVHAPPTTVCLVMDPSLIVALSALPGMTCMRMPGDPAGYAHDLYARLHDADRLAPEWIVIERPPSDAAWEAVVDRLTRASA